MNVNITNNYNNKPYNEIVEKVCRTCTNLLQLQQKSINIVFVDDKTIQEMNNTYRRIDRPTDVLTFPDGYLNNLGDVIISIETCHKQSIELSHSFERELGFLVAHGLLHTLGYDHQNEEDEAVMVALQNKILQKSKLFR